MKRMGNGNTGWCELQSEKDQLRDKEWEKKSNEIKKKAWESERILYVSKRFVEVSWSVRSK